MPKPRRLDGRNGDVARAYFVRGWTLQQIADEFEISNQRVSQIIEQARKEMPETDKGELLRESVELIRYVKDQAVELIEMAGAPVFVGKDGTLARDEEGNVVRDYSGRLRALDMALKADDTIAKRLGLDAASKIESTAMVRYELVQISPEDLT